MSEQTNLVSRFPRLYAAASLKRGLRVVIGRSSQPISAALCRGLIEAPDTTPHGASAPRISAALCRGLIEAGAPARRGHRLTLISAALCRGLIEATHYGYRDTRYNWRFPRLYAAASLKHMEITTRIRHEGRISAALCRGLIEARCSAGAW